MKSDTFSKQFEYFNRILSVYSVNHFIQIPIDELTKNKSFFFFLVDFNEFHSKVHYAPFKNGLNTHLNSYTAFKCTLPSPLNVAFLRSFFFSHTSV